MVGEGKNSFLQLGGLWFVLRIENHHELALCLEQAKITCTRLRLGGAFGNRKNGKTGRKLHTI